MAAAGGGFDFAAAFGAFRDLDFFAFFGGNAVVN